MLPIVTGNSFPAKSVQVRFGKSPRLKKDRSILRRHVDQNQTNRKDFGKNGFLDSTQGDAPKIPGTDLTIQGPSKAPSFPR